MNPIGNRISSLINFAPFLSLLFRSLVLFSFLFLVYDLPSFLLLLFFLADTHAVLACFIYPSFFDLFGNVSAVVGCRSVGQFVHARARQLLMLSDLARTNERENERSRSHRARLPYTTVSFVLSLSLSPSHYLPRLLSLSLSSLTLPSPTYIRRTPGIHSVVKNPAAARRSCVQLPLL